MVDDSSCEAILDTVGKMAGDWGIIFLAECDAHMTAAHHLNFRDHYCARFWAGIGSVPFCIIVRNWKRHCLRSVVQRGRACRVHLAAGSREISGLVFCLFAWRAW